MELSFLRSIIFIQALYEKMLNNNIPDPGEQNRQLLARLWDGMKRKGDGKCYCPCSQCRGFKRRIIKITTTRKHCREHDTFNVRMDDDDDDHENDDFDGVHDLPLLEKAYEPLYEVSNTNILSVILLIMNLKVMNGLSSISVTQMLRQCKIIHHIYMIVIKIIFVP